MATCSNCGYRSDDLAVFRAHIGEHDVRRSSTVELPLEPDHRAIVERRVGAERHRWTDFMTWALAMTVLVVLTVIERFVGNLLVVVGLAGLVVVPREISRRRELERELRASTYLRTRGRIDLVWTLSGTRALQVSSWEIPLRRGRRRDPQPTYELPINYLFRGRPRTLVEDGMVDHTNHRHYILDVKDAAGRSVYRRIGDDVAIPDL